MIAVGFLELRRSSNRWLVPLYVALSLFVVSNCLRDGVLLWSDVNYGFAELRGVLDPLAVGVCAWEAGRRMLRGWLPRLRGATLPSTSFILPHFLAGWAWIGLSWVTSLAAMTAWMGLRGGAGHADWWWLLADLGSLLVSGAVGYVLGTIGHGFWAVPPAAALGTYLTWQLFLDRIPSWGAQLNPVTITQTSPFVESVVSTFVGQLFWYAGIAIVVLVGMSALVDRSLSLPAGVGLATTSILAVAGLLLVSSTDGATTRILPHVDRVCALSPVRICVLEGFESGLPALERDFDSLNVRAAGTQLVAHDLVHQGEGAGGTPPAGVRWLYMEDLAKGAISSAVLLYVQTYTNANSCATGDKTIAHSIVESWLAGAPSPVQVNDDSPASLAVKKWYKLSELERTEWLRAHYAPLLTCSVSLSDL